MKVGFIPKYGYTEIDIPINGGKIYEDNAPPGLSNLAGQVFTIINQIPESSTLSTKVRWIKHRIENCGKRDGISNGSNGTMAYKANTWTAYLYKWQDYKAPHWLDGGYYSLSDAEKEQFFTVGVGDLIIFGDISDETPASLSEFNNLKKKYADLGGIVTSAEAYINFKPDGTAWKTNHIEVIKG